MLGSASGEASTITVSAFAGPGTNLKSTASVQVDVTSTAQAELSYTISGGPMGTNCTPLSGMCPGIVNDIATIGTNSVSFSGNYTLENGMVTGSLGPMCDSAVTAMCSITLNPGLYAFTVSVSDSLGASTGSPAAFSEGFGGVLTVTSGNVQVLPEPATAGLVPIALAAGWMWRRRRSARLRYDDQP